MLPVGWAADQVAPPAIGHETTGLNLKGGIIRGDPVPVKQTPTGPVTYGTTPYPDTFRYLGDAPGISAPSALVSDDRPKPLEFLPQTFFGTKVSLFSVLLRLTLVLLVLGALAYGGWKLWHKK